MGKIREFWPEKVTIAALGRAPWAESTAQRHRACEQQTGALPQINLPPILVSLTCPCPAEAALLCPALVSLWPGPASTLGLSCVPGLPKFSASFSYSWLHVGCSHRFQGPALAPLPGRHSLAPGSQSLLPHVCTRPGAQANSQFPWVHSQTSLNWASYVPRCPKRGFSLNQGLAPGRKPGQF